MSDKKVGLVLEGGGMRGIYTTGVLDELMANGIDVDGVIGVSAGIIHGISYVSEQYGRNIRYTLKCRDNKLFMSAYSFFKTGNICCTEYCYDEIPNKLFKFDYETFKKNAEKIETYAVATNLETGAPEYIKLTDLTTDEMDAVRASASMPIVSQTVEFRGMKLLDGGSADSIPIHAMKALGFKKNIVVLTRPAGYEKKPDSTMPIMKKLYGDYPNYLRTCANRHLDYNTSLKYLEALEKRGDTLVIRPSRDLKVGRTEKNPDAIKRIYKLGRYDARNLLDDLKKFVIS